MSTINPISFAAMSDELTKQSNLLQTGLGMAGRLGGAVLGGAGKAVKAVGGAMGNPQLSRQFGQNVIGRGVQAMGSRPALNQAVGLGTAGLGLAGASFAAGRMSKQATADLTGQQHEEMNRARWIQAAKDLPLVMLGTGVGFGVGKTVADHIAPHIGAAGKAAPYLPGIMSMLSAGGAYMLGQQREALRGRRDAAAARAVEAEKTAAPSALRVQRALSKASPGRVSDFLHNRLRKGDTSRVSQAATALRRKADDAQMAQALSEMETTHQKNLHDWAKTDRNVAIGVGAASTGLAGSAGYLVGRKKGKDE